MRAGIEECGGGCLNSSLDSLVFSVTFCALREELFFDVTKLCCDGCLSHVGTLGAEIP
jgi:hypothetical protein